MEQIAQTSNGHIAWKTLPDGSRRRWWCKTCRDQGKDWLAPEPCEHVLAATEETQISDQIAEYTRQALINMHSSQEAPQA
jgi:hypothetical protein